MEGIAQANKPRQLRQVQDNTTLTMEKTTPASSTVIPTVDLSPFKPGGDEASRKKAMDTISDACTNLGVFHIVNGIPVEQCEEFLKLNHTFFSYSDEMKKKSTEADPNYPDSGDGYGRMTDKFHKFEYLLMHSPEIFKHNNGVPTIPQDYGKTYEEIFKSFLETAQLLEQIINDCLGLPKDFLKSYNNDRTWDFVMPMYYTPATRAADIGIIEHEDPQFLTITLIDDVSGYEVYDYREWIPTTPTKVKLTVVIGDILQVLSNKKNKNVTHRVFKNDESHRLAVDFVYSFGPDKWIQPLPLLSGETGTKPKYKGFLYKDYMDLVAAYYNSPPIDITYYEI